MKKRSTPRVAARVTSRIRRPSTPAAASDAGRSRLGDLTRPIPIDRRLLRRRRFTLGFGLVAIAVLGAFAATLFVLPIQTFRAQGDTLDIRERQLARLVEVNDQLQAEVNRLRTIAGIREAARAELGFFEAGEQTLTVLPPTGALPTDLPGGWPYGLYRAAIAVRSGQMAP